MVTKKDIRTFIAYNKFDFYCSHTPIKYQQFSNSNAFKTLDLVFDRLLLEKNTNVSLSFSEETRSVIKVEFDSQETINYFKDYVQNYDPNKLTKTKPWWKLW